MPARPRTPTPGFRTWYDDSTRSECASIHDTGPARGGASIVTGGGRQWPLLIPTALTDCRLFREKVFGPVICVIAFANDSPYGLTAVIFTSNLDENLSAARRIRVGSLHINETSRSQAGQ
jgi:succinate-semialdehyde dehydrogenase/glutarate-semialdehyde dehydrogenase